MATQRESTRYAVVPILTGGFGDPIVTTDDADEAKRTAETRAYDYYYGTAVIDHQTDTVDFGDRIVPLADAGIE